MGRRETIEALLTEALGPVRWSHTDAGVVEVGGSAVVVEMSYARGGRDVKELAGVRLGVPLNGRPVRLAVDSTQMGRSSDAIATGDDAFDRVMEVKGWPEEVCVAAVDAEARRYLVDAFDQRWPYVETEDGQLRMARRLVDRGSRPDAEPGEVAEMARCLVAIADRLVDGYDEARDAVRRSHGDTAAQEWDLANAQGWDARDTRRRRTRLLVAVVLLVVMLAVVSLAVLPLL